MRRFALAPPIVAAAALLLPSPAVAKPKPKLPDLTVKAAGVDGQGYAVRGEDPGAKTQFDFTVFNTGDKATGRKSLARAQVVHSLHGSFRLGYRQVPELGPRHGDAGKLTTPIMRAPAGAYRVRVCADIPDRVRESNENNNCDYFKLDDPHYYVVNNNYTGTVGGVFDNTSTGGWTETWHIQPNATFGPVTSRGHGNFSYFLSGTVYYTDSGGSGGCTVSGSGAGGVIGSLQIHFEDDTYVGFGQSTTSYPVFSSCSSTPDQGPLQPTVWDPQPSAEEPNLAFGNQIAGASTDGETNWSWTLDGAD